MPKPAANNVEYSVTEISTAVKRTVEDAFSYVRVRGEISGFRGVHASGHCYFALKDEKSRIEAVVWRSTVARLKFQPEEGIEVIATGRVTTFAGQSKYQIVIESLEPAGVGALMALLDKRRKKLAAEGLFAEERKQALPYLPRTIGVVTSPTGAVIRDILHRLGDRFPSHVLVWPVRVQGETSPAEVIAAIHGFNTMARDSQPPRPDVIIIARGGGSLEDLWGFNDEALVRAVAESAIPVISAVGHETDVTLIDHAADRRAPTPTAAAEIAVPVRSDLIATVADLSGRLATGAARNVEALSRDLRAATRALPAADDLLSSQRRLLDGLASRLGLALRANASVHRNDFERISGRLSLPALRQNMERNRQASRSLAERLELARTANARGQRAALEKVTARHSPSDLLRLLARHGDTLRNLSGRNGKAWRQTFETRQSRLSGQAKLLEAVSYRSVLGRGFALVTGDDGQAIRSVRAVPPGKVMDIMFHDGTASAVSKGAAKKRPRRQGSIKPGSSQGSLF
jgi:exodeoxyribonuclease VII large subunit